MTSHIIFFILCVVGVCVYASITHAMTSGDE